MKKMAALGFALGFLIAGCSNSENRAKGVCMLVDTSGVFSSELTKAQTIISYLLATLQPNDTLVIANVGTESFSERDIIAKVTFAQRPSVANNQKRVFQKEVHKFLKSAGNTKHTDISGGILQAIESLNEAGSMKKYILIFSDLKEELAEVSNGELPFQLTGIYVVAVNVTKLREGVRDTEPFLDRVEDWRMKIEHAHGNWSFVNDLERLETVFAE
ncbi:MAG: VWA domain-containing protein [Deltaproteobacteria bacterium]|nr:MAG: VWA domain-containing protein [Deltaproteobacteria bacterium]